MAGRCVYGQHAGSGDVIVAPGNLRAGSYMISVEAESYKEVFLLTKQ